MMKKVELSADIKNARAAKPSSLTRALTKDDSSDLELLLKSENPEIQALCRVLNLNDRQASHRNNSQAHS